MKIGKKILLTVLLVLLIGGGSQLMLLGKLNQITDEVDKEQWWANRAMQAIELRVATEHQVSALAECVLFATEESIQHFNEVSQQATDHFQTLINETKRVETKQQLKKIQSYQREFLDLANNQIIPAVRAGDTQLASEILFKQGAALMENLEADLDSWVADRRSEVAQQQQLVVQLEQQAITYGITFTVVAIIVGILISIWLARNITNILNKLIGRAEAIAAGDLTQRIDEVNGRDEAAELARAFNKMQEQLKALLNTITTDSMTLAAQSEQLSAASQEVSANVHGIAGLTTELAATAENQAANASEATAVSKEAERVAREGGQAVRDVVTKMESISATVNNSSQVMGKLSEQSQQIGQIIEVITGIADQTNLLALNAAIEAARAGEQGRGFAVVADEVRNLAEQSAGAAKEIYAIVSEIRNDIEQAVNAMDMGAREVNEGVAVVERAGRSLDEIVAKVAESSAYISEISVGTEQTSDASQELAQSTDQVNAAVENIVQSTVSLSQMAEQLNNLARKFKLEKTEQTDYWQDKDPCWEIKKCVAEGRDPQQCNAFKYSHYPCWNIYGTHCKGESGWDIRKCKECEVYQKYGDNAPLVVFNERLLDQ